MPPTPPAKPGAPPPPHAPAAPPATPAPPEPAADQVVTTDHALDFDTALTAVQNSCPHMATVIARIRTIAHAMLDPVG